MLCSQLIDHVRANTTLPIAFGFCKPRRGVSFASRDLFKSLLVQLVRYQKKIIVIIVEQFFKKGLPSSTENLQKVLEMLLRLDSTVRIVIDGVDELEDLHERKGLLQYLLKLSMLKESGCKVLASSTKIRDIDTLMRGRPVLVFDLDLYSGKVSKTISDFLESRSVLFQDLQDRFGIDVAAFAKTTLIEKANGE